MGRDDDALARRAAREARRAAMRAREGEADEMRDGADDGDGGDTAARGARDAATAAAVGAAVGAMRALTARRRDAGEEPEEEPDEADQAMEAQPADDEDDAADDEVAGEEQPRQSPPAREGARAEQVERAVQAAKDQLRLLNGAEAEAVSSFGRTRDGWRVTLEVVEVRRIPETTDVLASYVVELDEDGGLVAYERLRRYQRSEALDSP
jgi:hypothetical protein